MMRKNRANKVSLLMTLEVHKKWIYFTPKLKRYPKNEKSSWLLLIPNNYFKRKINIENMENHVCDSLT